MKRIFDFTLAVLGIIISFPLCCIFGFLIWIEDKGNVFYLQERVGLNGKIFRSIKFRSMIIGAEKYIGPLQEVENDPRVTNIGKLLRITAMDELPQLINIAKGEMSFVGPRALRPVEIDTADGKAHSIWEFVDAKERSKVVPGLTGVAQILASRDIPREIKFKYDIWYIKNRNFLLDLYIILLSFLVTFLGRWEMRSRRFKRLTRGLEARVEVQ